MELNFGNQPLQVGAPNVPAKLGSSSGYQTDSEQETVNDILFGRTDSLQDQINALVVGGARGEWVVRVGGAPPDDPSTPDGELMVTTSVWSDVDFLWFDLVDNDGIPHDLSFLTQGDRIRVFQGDSFGTYRVKNYSDTDPGKVYVEPMLTGLAGSVQDGELASITFEDLDGSGTGGPSNALTAPVRWGELIFGQAGSADAFDGVELFNTTEVLTAPVTWLELVARNTTP